MNYYTKVLILIMHNVNSKCSSTGRRPEAQRSAAADDSGRSESSSSRLLQLLLSILHLSSGRSIWFYLTTLKFLINYIQSTTINKWVDPFFDFIIVIFWRSYATICLFFLESLMLCRTYANCIIGSTEGQFDTFLMHWYTYLMSNLGTALCLSSASSLNNYDDYGYSK